MSQLQVNSAALIVNPGPSRGVPRYSPRRRCPPAATGARSSADGRPESEHRRGAESPRGGRHRVRHAQSAATARRRVRWPYTLPGRSGASCRSTRSHTRRDVRHSAARAPWSSAGAPSGPTSPCDTLAFSASRCFAAHCDGCSFALLLDHAHGTRSRPIAPPSPRQMRCLGDGKRRRAVVV